MKKRLRLFLKNNHCLQEKGGGKSPSWGFSSFFGSFLEIFVFRQNSILLITSQKPRGRSDCVSGIYWYLDPLFFTVINFFLDIFSKCCICKSWKKCSDVYLDEVTSLSIILSQRFANVDPQMCLDPL